MASIGTTSEPHEGQWNIPSGRRRISGWPHSQACSPEAPGSGIICSRVSSIAVPSTHPHEPQRAPSPPKGCSSPAWQSGQTRKSDPDVKVEDLKFESLSLILTGNLEAEREREQQHDKAEETYHPKGEQRDYRCERVSYVTGWLLHLLSPLFSIGA